MAAIKFDKDRCNYGRWASQLRVCQWKTPRGFPRYKSPWLCL